ncbi:proteinaceous RNase P 1, chloroplastic/mitochondrial-like [Gastrolobium bilobum]|uniref:proteinaceous RNase P 1, chloroplastic/mitochondrial-like n=1 Tax=Gastrolobium bilobum TaxID=150636 RepID=UPI002AB1C8A8|nr:proteinaceous RNase P 1, chloroplastic/mitochondrial-like [Gastrolobium bilobum]XP_061343861.1 proteinaceous RNase P 1, chloroplastic/mitochondrial-like [Gastrolobium bilobum]
MATFTLNLNTLHLQQSLSFSHSLRTTLHGFSSTWPSTNTINCNETNKTGTVSVRSFSRRVSLDSKASSSSYRVSERVKKKPNENLVDKKNKDTPQAKLRVALDMCSKRGDVMGALSLYDSARSQGVKLGQHQYTVLLYLCSSAAVGVVQPAKSGSGARTLNALVSSNEVVTSEDLTECGSIDRKDRYFSNAMLDNPVLNASEKSEKREANPFTNDSSFVKHVSSNQEDQGILVSEDVKKYALKRGFEVYENMCQDKVQMNEAALTSVARMAMSMGDGDMAFEMVKQMKFLGINPRLRSYGPALSTYCNDGEIDKAFAVEKHMLEHGVYPEEPELEALLRVSIRAGKGDKVYYVLHKLRSNVRKVSPSTAYLIIDWFNSKHASRVGKRKWDKRLIMEAIENNGGGWHGQGWLGKGKWEVLHTTIGNDGMCKCCGVHLDTIDIDPIETENFAKSVASIAIMREKNSNFQKFQKWLDYHGPFEAVVDAANVGLFGQRRFMPSKINSVVNGIRQKLPSKKFPLIILHNKRIKGDKMDEPINRALIDKWNNADALYATPTGSNDDWYWLYAAIKFKCLIVTNDEMRDHLFQLLGNDFFPKWKERHQVRFSFSDTGPEFHMPPSCSVVIQQESEEGHWHIPIETELTYESERRWLCITRAKLDTVCKDSSTTSEGSLCRGEEKTQN